MKKILSKVSDKTKFPLEIISSAPKIEITDNQRLYIENHKGIRLLSSETVVIKINTGYLIINGVNIKINEIDKYSVNISGNIHSFKFEKNLE